MQRRNAAQCIYIHARLIPCELTHTRLVLHPNTPRGDGFGLAIGHELFATHSLNELQERGLRVSRARLRVGCSLDLGNVCL